MRKKKSFKIQKKKNILLKLLRYELINDNVYEDDDKKERTEKNYVLQIVNITKIA